MCAIEISQSLDPPLIVPYYPKPFIIGLYKTLSSDTLQLLRQYGKVILFGNAYTNVPIQSLSFDYFIIDLREKDHRFYYKRYIYNYHEQYYCILYRYIFENNNGIFFHNELTEFPTTQITKEEFDTILLESPLPSPSCCLASLCNYICTK